MALGEAVNYVLGSQRLRSGPWQSELGLETILDRSRAGEINVHLPEAGRIFNGCQRRRTGKLRKLNMSDVAERVKKIVVEHLGVEPDKVTEDASFIDDLGADSLDTVELVMAFEEEFGIEIPDDAAETIQTVGDAVNFIKKSAA